MVPLRHLASHPVTAGRHAYIQSIVVWYLVVSSKKVACLEACHSIVVLPLAPGYVATTSICSQTRTLEVVIEDIFSTSPKM